jgi:hypothetical protein
MAYDNDQQEFQADPNPDNRKVKSTQFLPKFFRTPTNEKFLQSTMDQMIQPGVAEKISGYIGRQVSKAREKDDNYLSAVTQQRTDYQLEPATVIKDDLGNVLFYKDYQDFINQTKSFNGNVDDHSRLNSQEYYAWSPNIDWDKFTNFREYFWLPNGPQPVAVFGQTTKVTSTYNVAVADQGDNFAYTFSATDLTANPSIKLYRGQTYSFVIDAANYPMAIATSRSFINEDPNDPISIYKDGIVKFDNEGNEVTDLYISNGVIQFTIPENAPSTLYYVSSTSINTSGYFKVYDVEESSEINIDNEILGKTTYRTGEGFDLSNGMKVYFQGNVTPAIYASGEWYVDGVGDSIVLINSGDLEIPATYSTDLPIPFDTDGFDRLPFDNASSYAGIKDYIVVNRASKDRNAWSRYNRWFHRSVIEQSAVLNGQAIDNDIDQRARRPIIEFNAGIKLYNFGTEAKTDIDLIDDFTSDAFSIIEGSIGYNIDGVTLAEGMRVLFTADPDSFVSGKIFKVKFVTFENKRQITLIATADSTPLENETVLVKQGSNAGVAYFYNGTSWIIGQPKTKTNQAPKFDLYNSEESSFADSSAYPATTFAGNTIFTYKVGAGTNDTELGFPLSYRAFENIGDLLFSYNLLQQADTYTNDNLVIKLESKKGYLRRYTAREDFSYTNGWQKGRKLSNQKVIRQYFGADQSNNFAIDVYDKSGEISDLQVFVTVNNSFKSLGADYTISTASSIAYVKLNNALTADDRIVIKTTSTALKNSNGYYEIASNLERNPLNNDLNEFTLGEVNAHVGGIVEEVFGFNGAFPGNSNLRDLGDVAAFGKTFVKHSAPFNLANFHITNRDYNIVKALRYNSREYAKFKRVFMQKAFSLGFDGPIKQHVDTIFQEINKDKTEAMPFYFSDMVPISAPVRIEYTVVDPRVEFYALGLIFDDVIIGELAVLVYLNGTQLVKGQDYIFDTSGFCVITAEKAEGDLIEIYEYDLTDGSYVPPTPTKLGLYPSYRPALLSDTTYREPVNVIQGHDGSITVAYNDYRDDLLLELEKRIFNNIKQPYREDIFDINAFVGGEYRNTGFSRKLINNATIFDFTQWLGVVGSVDYTKNTNYSRSDSFTYNYKFMASPSGKPLPGYWRAVYKEAYDTARPHTHPWEMLGYTAKPAWWEITYGPAPYTSNNLILWEDIENGIVREPAKELVLRPKYARPGLSKHIPVGGQGELLSPLASGYAQGYIASLADTEFAFGDEAPVEAAWRRSSEFPFSLITGWLLNQPHKVMGTGFDLSRIKRDLAGHLVYTETQQQIRLVDLKFPNNTDDAERITTSGLANMMANYLASSVLLNYDRYINYLTSVNTQLGMKIGGFTDKAKFQMILDSRTPLNKSNVLIPEENYQIFLNTSSPIDVVDYSGVIIEKQDTGFIIRGYDKNSPGFKYYKTLAIDSDSVINIGGISQPFTKWQSGRSYVAGQIVLLDQDYYRVKTTHTSSATFEADKFARLPFLPIVGGRDIFVRKRFDRRVAVDLAYGTTLKTIQDVADFMFGYNQYLLDRGFEFNYFDTDNNVVENWLQSIKEFAFWTTQNWDNGSVITLSPGAQQLRFNSKFSVVDNLFDNFYDYSIYKADGNKLREEFTTRTRTNDNEFIITPRNTADGVYNIKLPLVQKEHVLLLDNRTVFNDILFDPEPGYRQERIRVVGYRSDDWTGGLNIPGFFYDEAATTSWEPNQDYAIAAVVKYKEFYYSANVKIGGTPQFNAQDWIRLPNRPEPKLFTNFDFHISQFADFYDLDSDNFDADQQKLAQHLIGYQQREYLRNIINDDISQYKFYQGFIKDKGTLNSLTNLFDALAAADKESLEFYEEWAVRIGQVGAVDKYEEVEYVLDETKFLLTPQPVELTSNIDPDDTRLIYRIKDVDTYLRPENYTHTPFPTTQAIKEFVPTAGYVHRDDADYTVFAYDDILDQDINTLAFSEIVWVGREGQTWNIYRYAPTDFKVKSIDLANDGMKRLNLTISPNFTAGDIIGLSDLLSANGFYKIDRIEGNSIIIDSEDIEEVDEITPLDFGDSTTQEVVLGTESGLPRISVFKSVRFNDVSAANTFVQNNGVENNDKIWVDNALDDTWTVFRNIPKYTDVSTTQNPADYAAILDNYSSVIAVSSDNKTVAVAAPDSGEGKVYIYERPTETGNLIYKETLSPELTISDAGLKFGSSLAISPDSKYLIVGSPEASNVLTRFKDGYVSTATYQIGDIVTELDSLWEANTIIAAAEAAIAFSTFSSYPAVTATSDSSPVNLLTLANYTQPLTLASHILVRAPFDMWEGVAVGDRIVLEWNQYSQTNDNGSLTLSQPFLGTIPGIDHDYITAQHAIVEKVDIIVYIDVALSALQVGDTVSSNNASGVISYINELNSTTVLYLNQLNGVWAETGELFFNNITLIGSYIIPDYDPGPLLGGYFQIASPEYNTGSGPYTDEGRGLIYRDVLRVLDTRDINIYESILDVVAEIGNPVSLSDQVSFISALSYRGDPGDVLADQLDNRWVIRASKELTDQIAVNDTFSMYFDTNVTETLYGFEEDYFDETEHTVIAKWKGYIEFTFTNFQTVDTDGDGRTSDPFEPEVGTIIEDATTGARAEVAFYRRQFNTVRVYVINVTGIWSLGENYGELSEVTRIGSGGKPNRLMGDISAVSLGTTTVGDILVVQAGSVFDVPAESDIINAEYWVYKEVFNVAGVPRPASIPSSNNNDWKQVYNLPADVTGTGSGLAAQGTYSVYARRPEGSYALVNTFVDPVAVTNSRFGAKLEITQRNDLYTLYVSSEGNGTADNSGKINFIISGQRDGVTYNWELAKDRAFRGVFSSTVFYLENEYVTEANVIYQAITNIAPGSSFDITDWTQPSTGVSYLGYVPLGNNYNSNDARFAPSSDLLKFAYDFDVSNNGEVIVVSSKLYFDDSTEEGAVQIYRRYGDHYTIAQTISALVPGTQFGESVAISNNAQMIAIGEPYNDDRETDQGVVYVYLLTNGQYILAQTLNSTTNEKGEQFGSYLDFDDNQLIVTSLHGDMEIDTTFDKHTASFDQNLTRFRKVKFDTGLVQLYERINNSLIHAADFAFDNDSTDVTAFGKSAIVRDNHLYIGLTHTTDTSNSYQGMLLDYRKVKNTLNWETYRQPSAIVNVRDIKKAFLYNKRTNEFLTNVDFIDPVQGKIAGLADQDISYKTTYDPATYTTGETVNISATDNWAERYVGRVWWDLSTALFVDPHQGDIIYQSNTWNTLFDGASIDVYEWVESNILPSRWEALSGTEDGIARGISGTTKYGDEVYTQKSLYDSISQSFTPKYYFWVKNKVTIPDAEFRRINVLDIARLIADPFGQRYRFVSLLSNDRFSLNNVDTFLEDKDVVLSFQIWKLDNRSMNIHNEYQILSEGFESSLPKRDVEMKWFDSLIGRDAYLRPVPDPQLSPKLRYGNLNRPRQGWFVNRKEALKQVIERVNYVLKDELITDDFNLSNIEAQDPQPTVFTNLYDRTIDTVDQLALIGISRVRPAVLTPVIEDGRIVSVAITDSGRGYLTTPTFTIIGQGESADIQLTINQRGEVDSATVLNQGQAYSNNTSITVRYFAVLVQSDSTANNKWSIYSWNEKLAEWQRSRTQEYNVNLYWDYQDWYASGYNRFTQTKFSVSQSYEITALDDRIGDVIRIRNVGAGGWVLLRKVDTQVTVDYTINYETIGRQNGTVKFLSTLYDPLAGKTGYDTANYDVVAYDNDPTVEIRKILEAIRDDIFVDQLQVEYNKLFFASLRYVFTEQGYVDWAFKTSFVLARHNVGTLKQKVTFQNDNLPSYEDYINEAKPYKTKIREYVSTYDVIDDTGTVISDFDLPPSYNEATKSIQPQNVQIVNNALVGTTPKMLTNPFKQWLDNYALKVSNIQIQESGSGYLIPPIVTIIGGGGTGATARAFIGAGRVTRIVVTSQGSGYVSTPTIAIEGSQRENGTLARASATLGESPVRSMQMVVKFDRVSGNYYILDISQQTNFVGTGSKTRFGLNWPMDLRKSTVQIFVDGTELLRSEYNFINVLDTTKSYARELGQVLFTIPPVTGATVQINYQKNPSLLTAQDRINFYYSPTSGQLGKDLGQLMDGVDYGGVEVKSFAGFGGGGWDTSPWYTGKWDSYDTTFEDEIFVLDGSTTTINLAAALVDGIEYNIYRNGVRLDDPGYPSSPENINAITETIYGDGLTSVVDLQGRGIAAIDGDLIIIRKSTSDGSFMADPDTFDTLLSGGDLTYSSAKGISADQIIIDGDGFVTPLNSKGPEELVPGQILDTLDIQVYDKLGDGGAGMYSANHISNGGIATYDLSIRPNSRDAVFIKVDNVIIDSDNYTIDYSALTVTFASNVGQLINIIVMGRAGDSIADAGTFIGDGSTAVFGTSAQFEEGLVYNVQINGTPVSVQLAKTVRQQSFTFTADGSTAVFELLYNLSDQAEVQINGETRPSITYAVEQGVNEFNEATFLLSFQEGMLGVDDVVTVFDAISLVDMQFAVAPPIGAIIAYAIYSSISTSFSIVSLEEFTGDGSTAVFALTQAPLVQTPTRYRVLVEVAGKILPPGYSRQFTVGAEREYPLEQWQFPSGSVLPVNVIAYLNGVEIVRSIKWQYDTANSAIVLFAGVGEVNDTLIAYVVDDGDYRLSGADLTLDIAPAIGQKVKVWQFTNHNILDIERKTYDVIARAPLTRGTNDFSTYTRLTNGLIKLINPAVDAQYIWVTLNGETLSPSVDYYVTDDLQYIKIVRDIEEDDVVDLMHFARPAVTQVFGFRQFKDMLNRTVYKRLDESSAVILAQDLNWYDQRIELVDGSNIPEPNKEKNIPGVLFINGERIEFFIKDGNMLRQLRRGTRGTGTPEVNIAGTKGYEQGTEQTIPYKDQTRSQLLQSDGTTNIYTLDFVANSSNDVEVFVGGRRLRNNMISIFDPTLDLDSPEGDVESLAQFAIDGDKLTLTEDVPLNTNITVVRKIGQQWTATGDPMRYSETQIARFIRARSVDVPE